MPITLTDDAGSTTANTFADLVEFKSFIATRLPTPVFGDIAGDELLTLINSGDLDDELSRSLIASATLLCGSFIWNGSISFAIQRLCFPRTGLVDREGRTIDPLLNPLEIKLAQCELAVYLFGSADILGDNEAKKLGVKSVKADTVSIEFQASSESYDSLDMEALRSSTEYLYLRIPSSVLAYIPLSWYARPQPSAVLKKRKPLLRTL